MTEQYKERFLKTASSFDAVANAEGEFTTCAMEVAKGGESEAVLRLCKLLTSYAGKGNERVREVAKVVKASLIEMLGYESLREKCGETRERAEEPSKTLEELLAELNSLVGLQKVKEKVKDLIAFQRVQKMRREAGLASSKNTMHLAFTGNPGTGKTTVARIVGRMYKQLGLLSKGHFLEVSRTDLIAGYQGQTALKVKEVIKMAKGGVLFIDEAYSITENEHTDSYGRECLTELTKALEDYRDDLVVIVAGYTEPMNVFFQSNPGLKSRFNTFIEFEDYNAEELGEIFKSMCKANDYVLREDAESALRERIEAIVNEKTEEFANGRVMRNLFDDVVMRQAKRVCGMEEAGRRELMEVWGEDIS